MYPALNWFNAAEELNETVKMMIRLSLVRNGLDWPNGVLKSGNEVPR